jgi:hypothetical protein
VVAELPLVLDVPEISSTAWEVLGLPGFASSALVPDAAFAHSLRSLPLLPPSPCSRSLPLTPPPHSLLRSPLSQVDLTRRLATATYTRGRGGKSIMTGVVGECAILIAGVSLVTSCTDYATKTLDIVFRRT